MGLLAICYPELAPDDFDRIQILRKRHDPHYDLIDPHISLVFAVDDVSQNAFITHVRSKVRTFPKIPFAMRCASTAPGILDDDWFLMMIPDEGFSGLLKLHDRLYTGLLRRYLRLDIPFIPHITVGVFKDPKKCRNAADRINKSGFAVSGRITTVEVLSYEDDCINTLEQIELADK
jgi:2'-5' RNA ligase